MGLPVRQGETADPAGVFDGRDVALRVGGRDHRVRGAVDRHDRDVGVDVLDGVDRGVALGGLVRRPAQDGDDAVVAVGGRVGHVEWSGEGDDSRGTERRFAADLVVVERVTGPGPHG